MFDDAFGRGQGGDSRRAMGCMGIALAVFLLITAVRQVAYSVDRDETGVVQRFGAFARTEGPGLNFKWPFIERVTMVLTEKQLKAEFGFRTLRAGVESDYQTGPLKDRLMLTGDLNVADVQWVVQYRIRDPEAYLFNVRNPDATLQALSEVTMRTVVGDRHVDEVLNNRLEISLAAKDRLQEAMDLYETGISIDTIAMQDVLPPPSVRPAFNDVNDAMQEKEQLINEAKQRYNEVIPLARGQADQTIAEAEGYAARRVNEAQVDVARFLAVMAEWERATEVTEIRLYLEAMEKLIERVAQILVVDGETPGVLPLLDLAEGGK